MKLDLERIKQAGLDLDLAAVSTAGPAALHADDHYRLKMQGICYQVQFRHRDEGAHMVRLRRPGGGIRADQLAGLADLAERHGDATIRLTTRQGIELHSVPTAALAALTADLAALGLTSRSSCGHTIRNVMADPIPTPGGIDLAPLAAAVNDHVVDRSAGDNHRWPQRLNIGFMHARPSGTANRHQDIGLDVHPDGRMDVWVGGSVGSDPRPAELLLTGIPLAACVRVVRAIAETFIAHARRDRPKKARLKYVIVDHGLDAFRAGVRARLDDHPDLELRNPVTSWGPTASSEVLHVPEGDLSLAQARAIAGAALQTDARIRIDAAQNLVVIHDDPARLAVVRDAAVVVGLDPVRAGAAVDVRSCVGARYCSLAITASVDTASDLRSALADVGDLPLRVAVSGCPNSCAHHQVADIGLAGALVRGNGRTSQAYQVYLGGRPLTAETEASEGTRVDLVSAQRAPHLVLGLAAVLATERGEDERMADVVGRLGATKVLELARQFA